MGNDDDDICLQYIHRQDMNNGLLVSIQCGLNPACLASSPGLAFASHYVW